MFYVRDVCEDVVRFYSFSQGFGNFKGSFLFATVVFQQAEWHDILKKDVLPKPEKATDRVMQVCWRWVVVVVGAGA